MTTVKHAPDTGLTSEDIEIIHSIFRKYPSVKHVKIFGSRANGRYKNGSDIDLVILNNDFKCEDIASIRSDFEESALPYFVDIIDYKSITNNNLKDHINSIGLEFYLI